MQQPREIGGLVPVPRNARSQGLATRPENRKRGIMPTERAKGIRPGTVLPDTIPASAIPYEIIPAQVEGARLRVMETLRSLNRYDVEIQKKFALAAACFIFVLLGAPIALRFPRGGVGLTIGVSLVVFGLYYVGLIAGESLARRGLVPPFVSMWIANAVFGLLALILLARMGKESGTSRGGDMRELIDSMKHRFRRRPATRVTPRNVPRTSES